MKYILLFSSLFAISFLINAQVVLQVSSSSDDASQRDNGSNFSTTDDTLISTSHNNPTVRSNLGFRFNTVTVPNGASITSATLDIYVPNQDDPQLDIYGHDVDNAPTFSAGANDVNTRARTTATVNWTASNIGTAWQSGPDLSTIVQEIVNRAGWAAGNSMVILLDAINDPPPPERIKAMAYDYSPALAAKLSITYTGLPVELLSFEPSLTSNQEVTITWQTATETNNDFFTVERSQNGATFNAFATVQGAGNSSSTLSYNAVDKDPLNGISYYRLKQTDYDGKYEYFDIVSVEYNINKDGSCVLKVFPNPCKGTCTINLADCMHGESEEMTIEIVDAIGNKVYSQVPARDLDGGFSFSVNTNNNLAPGAYIISGRSSNEKYTKRVIVK